MRTHYHNGDEISLQACGCDSCSPVSIKGSVCHEHGCTDAWRDYPKKCFECGCDFYPEDKYCCVCPDCSDEQDY